MELSFFVLKFGAGEKKRGGRQKVFLPRPAQFPPMGGIARGGEETKNLLSYIGRKKPMAWYDGMATGKGETK